MNDIKIVLQKLWLQLKKRISNCWECCEMNSDILTFFLGNVDLPHAYPERVKGHVQPSVDFVLKVNDDLWCNIHLQNTNSQKSTVQSKIL